MEDDTISSEFRNKLDKYDSIGYDANIVEKTKNKGEDHEGSKM